jgi:hypothetical protein
MAPPLDTNAPRQLLAYTFPPGSGFEGRLVGALQRIESGGALRILDAMFVGREPESGELVAVSIRSASSAGMIGKLIGFRMEGSARGKETKAALEGPAGPLIREVAEALEPGWAVAAVLVEHSWANVLSEAVARIGGAELANETLDASASEEAWARLPGELRARADAQT